jgi:hypothetical protein
MKPTGRSVQDFKSAHSSAERIARLEQELAKAQRESADSAAIKALVGELSTRIETLELPDWIARAPADSGSPGVPTLFLSDLHWGERVFAAQINGVNSYNLAIARKRLHHVVETAIELSRILDPKMRFPGIVMPLGGDIISGNLHEELSATNELNSMPAVLDIYGHLILVVNRLLQDFKHVFVPCVTGNHGRDTKKTWAKDRHHTSFDWLIYRFLAKHFEGNPNVTFFVPDGNDALYRIFGTRYLMTHGDNLGKGGDGLIGSIGPIMRGDHKKRSRNAQIDLTYDIMIHGHFHTYSHATKVIGNGSLKGLDEFAYVNNFGYEPPQQAMWITHPRHGVTFRMPVYADVGAKPPTTEWVSHVASTGTP